MVRVETDILSDSAFEAAPSLFDPQQLRAQCWKTLARAERGQSQHFEIAHTALQANVQALAMELAPSIERAQPPLNNCWHRLAEQFGDDLDHLARTLSNADDASRARSGLDLALLTTLADPGGSNDERFLTTVQNFTAGEFMGAERGIPISDAAGLQNWLEEHEEAGNTEKAIMKALVELLSNDRRRFGEGAQFGQLLDEMMSSSEGNEVSALALFEKLGALLQPLLPTPTRVGRQPAGDAWRAGSLFDQDTLISFQAPVVRLVEAMNEPLIEAGLQLKGLGDLPTPATAQLMTALMQLEIILPKHASVGRLRHPPGSDIIVELRCLAVALVDRLGDHLSKELKCNMAYLPPQRVVVPLLQAAEKKDNDFKIKVETGLF